MPKKINSKKLGKDIWLAEDIDRARDLYRSGVRDAIYLQDDIEVMKTGGIVDAMLAPMTLAKEIFPGAVLESTDIEGEWPKMTEEAKPWWLKRR